MADVEGAAVQEQRVVRPETHLRHSNGTLSSRVWAHSDRTEMPCLRKNSVF